MIVAPFFSGIHCAMPSAGQQGPVLDGLWAWHDAADTATTTVNNTNRVIHWADKSGNGRDVSRDSASSERPYSGTRTQNGLNVIAFQNAHSLQFAAQENPAQSGDCTLIMVAKADTSSSVSCLYHAVDTDANNHNFGLVINLNSGQGDAVLSICHEAAGAGQVNVSRLGSSQTDAGIFGMVRSGSNQQVIMNGTLGAAAPAVNVSPAGNAVYGARNNSGALNQRLEGFIAEVLLYNRALNGAEIAGTIAYLHTKWIP